MITDEANGEENFGESAGRSSVIGISVFITIGTEKFGEYPSNIFPHMYGICHQCYLWCGSNGDYIMLHVLAI